MEADPDGAAGICNMAFGTPPFKLFELPPLQASGEKRYVFYYDGGYGPMNIDENKPAIGDFGVFRQIYVANDDAAVAYASGGRPSYNSIVEYQNQYYFLMLVTFIDAYTLSVESVTPNRSADKQICRWSSVKQLSPKNQNKPRKTAKPLPLN